ncbi:hypothetical protein Bca4012_075927 [Brassica carinata]
MRIHSCHVSHDRSPIYAVVSCLSPERGVLSAENRPCHQRAVPCQAIAIPRRLRSAIVDRLTRNSGGR